jgi:peptide chain release factor 2
MASKEDIQKQIDAIELAMNEPDFWANPVAAQEKMKEYQNLKAALAGADGYDKGDALVSIVSGAGGDDAEDFSRMLFEMYGKYVASRGWKMLMISENSNSLGGYRNLAFEVVGPGAYGALKKEAGVHRLVRMSPFNSAGKRQTSFSLVEVLPKVPDTADVHIPDTDLDISFARSGGPGGQNVNKRDTAVHATHKPSGIHVHVTSERSQAQNKEKAIELIRSKLFAMKEAEAASAARGLSTGASTKIEWGSQIRSYVLHPYQLVKDHRTEHERRDIEHVLEGDIQSFIDAEREIE